MKARGRFCEFASGLIPLLLFIICPSVGYSQTGLTSKPTTPLIAAVSHDDREALKRLLKNHPDVNAVDQNGATALMIAVTRNHPDLIGLLVKHGANINAVVAQAGGTPLNAACVLERTLMVETLLTNGAKPDIRNTEGWTPLMQAAFSANTGILRLLLAKGANPNLKTEDGSTALLLSSGAPGRETHIECVLMLLQAGASVNAAKSSGDTPLMAAASRGDSKVVALLLKNGASAKLKDKRGRTALDFALRSKKDETIKLLSAIPYRGNR